MLKNIVFAVALILSACSQPETVTHYKIVSTIDLPGLVINVNGDSATMKMPATGNYAEESVTLRVLPNSTFVGKSPDGTETTFFAVREDISKDVLRESIKPGDDCFLRNIEAFDRRFATYAMHCKVLE